jgi:drug/metabolite transporter (DMT)-like permease
MNHKGIICGILAAVCYGTNPFGALPLYEEGVNTASVLFYRFSMAVLMLAVMLVVERKSFRVKIGELKTLLRWAHCLPYRASPTIRVSASWMPA